MDDQTTDLEDPATPFSADTDTGSESKLRGKLYIVLSAVLVIVIGVVLGYVAAVKVPGKSGSKGPLGIGGSTSNTNVALPSDYTRDSAQGIIKPKPDTSKIVGTHILQRDDSQFPVYIISSLVDLGQYQDKHVKILGVTYDCGKNNWCMEVNKVETI